MAIRAVDSDMGTRISVRRQFPEVGNSEFGFTTNTFLKPDGINSGEGDELTQNDRMVWFAELKPEVPLNTYHPKVFDEMPDRVFNADFERTLVVTIWNVVYPITEEILYQVFDPFGIVEMIELIPNKEQFQALVRYQFLESSHSAKSHLHARCIYDGCCMMNIEHLSKDFRDELVEEIPLESMLLQVMEEFKKEMKEIRQSMTDFCEKKVEVNRKNFKKIADEENIVEHYSVQQTQAIIDEIRHKKNGLLEEEEMEAYLDCYKDVEVDKSNIGFVSEGNIYIQPLEESWVDDIQCRSTDSTLGRTFRGNQLVANCEISDNLFILAPKVKAFEDDEHLKEAPMEAFSDQSIYNTTAYSDHILEDEKVGNEKVGENKLEEKSKTGAIQEFKYLFLEDFQEHPGRFYPLNTDYGIKDLSNKKQLDFISTQLAPQLVELMKMSFFKEKSNHGLKGSVLVIYEPFTRMDGLIFDPGGAKKRLKT